MAIEHGWMPTSIELVSPDARSTKLTVPEAGAFRESVIIGVFSLRAVLSDALGIRPPQLETMSPLPPLANFTSNGKEPTWKRLTGMLVVRSTEITAFKLTAVTYSVLPSRVIHIPPLTGLFWASSATRWI